MVNSTHNPQELVLSGLLTGSTLEPPLGLKAAPPGGTPEKFISRERLFPQSHHQNILYYTHIVSSNHTPSMISYKAPLHKIDYSKIDNAQTRLSKFNIDFTQKSKAFPNPKVPKTLFQNHHKILYIYIFRYI